MSGPDYPAVVALDLPEGLDLMQDVSAAAWVQESLWPWHWSPSQEKEPIRVGSFLPAVFAAYARILNPLRPSDGDPGITRWRDLAERNGVELGPESSFGEVSGIDDPRAVDSVAPLDGSLPEAETRALSALLAPFTTPERCWFCLWVGQGYWWHGAVTF